MSSVVSQTYETIPSRDRKGAVASRTGRHTLRLLAYKPAWLFLVVPLVSGGCGLPARLGTDLRGESVAKTFYVGGAGIFGNIGALDVPKGLRQGGFEGAAEVFAWQSKIGWSLRDHLDRSRNQTQALRLADKIEEDLDRFPDNPVNIIALSAGTGITTWALEQLREGYTVNVVVFFGSSLSRNYDLSSALKHIDGGLYNFYSRKDQVLRNLVPLAGTVDRRYLGKAVAGLRGFVIPRGVDQKSRQLYRARARNMPWVPAYRRYRYRGGHTDGTRRSFIRHIVTPLLLEERVVQEPQATTQPTTAPSTRPTSDPTRGSDE